MPGAPPMWVAFTRVRCDSPTTPSHRVRLALFGGGRSFPPAIARALREALRGHGSARATGSPRASRRWSLQLGRHARPRGLCRARAGRLQEVRSGRVTTATTYWPATPARSRCAARTSPPGVLGTTRRRTARVLHADGWLRTGDVADPSTRTDTCTSVDHAKDLIIVSGFNVFPAEVEDGDRRPPWRRRGRRARCPHTTHGEVRQGLCVARFPGRSSMRLGCDRALRPLASARYKCPGTVIFVDHSPAQFRRRA